MVFLFGEMSLEELSCKI